MTKKDFIFKFTDVEPPKVEYKISLGAVTNISVETFGGSVEFNHEALETNEDGYRYYPEGMRFDIIIKPHTSASKVNNNENGI